MKRTNLKIEVIISLIINIVLGSLMFAWACANLSAVAATVVGLAVIIAGGVFAVSFPKLVGGK